MPAKKGVANRSKEARLLLTLKIGQLRLQGFSYVEISRATGVAAGYVGWFIHEFRRVNDPELKNLTSLHVAGEIVARTANRVKQLWALYRDSEFKHCKNCNTAGMILDPDNPKSPDGSDNRIVCPVCNGQGKLYMDDRAVRLGCLRALREEDDHATKHASNLGLIRPITALEDSPAMARREALLPSAPEVEYDGQDFARRIVDLAAVISGTKPNGQPEQQPAVAGPNGQSDPA